MLKKAGRVYFEEEDINFIKTHLNDFSVEKISEILEIKKETLISKMVSIGFLERKRKSKGQKKTMAKEPIEECRNFIIRKTNGVIWTDAAIDFLKKNYSSLGPKKIGDMLGLSKITAHRKAKELGIKRDFDFKQKHIILTKKLYPFFGEKYLADHLGVKIEYVLAIVKEYGVKRIKSKDAIKSIIKPKQS